MQRLCQKLYCELPSIPRGKYCEIHRIKKRNKSLDIELNLNNLRINEEQKVLESFRKLEEERNLRREQEEDYQKTMEADRERLEYEKILILSKDKYFDDLKEKILLHTECLGENFYSIKIQMPNGSKINGKFSIESTVQDVREYVNLYIHENGIHISNYDLILNFPHRKISSEENDLSIQSLSKAKNFILYLSDLDA